MQNKRKILPLYVGGTKNHFQQVTEFLKLGAEAIAQTANKLQPQQVASAIQLLSVCKGKVVLVGVGKSGLIARKIAATLTSTGTVAVYLHPADALHGDLGIVTSNDVAILMSNSGETDELVEITPYLKKRQVPIITIVGNLSSTLARNADVVLDASVDKEACPLNLAPTTSTTVALAIGDAIAMTLMQVKGLTPEDFALNHPAGRLGKRLTLKVADIMHSGFENPIISPTATWLEVITAISQGGLGAVNVVDNLGQLLGIITDGDLRRSFQKIDPTKLERISSDAIMTKNPITVSPDYLAYDALQVMENRPSQISVMPVVDEQGICLGLIRLHDIVRSGL
ncbi:KpsF/GutQ family sugar-phosphate isomerase [Nostoc edaphicum CCNP1411]|uniref:KpsF/GutQ family sugar-phosphate isomerase n=1 Tax=Nostoc edaphicum CCNP1411 TaxID=1472755 RepID=A0A7D7QPP6_9NOSO|nr:KpsF/GutQ family sugar-phosphate isomerase [Nostoc edaphicum]QMS90665.1 KpsF/GutQ family sugar-phosphate isomerase [Nostoc edaphicum CCNP1411]